MMTTEQTKFQVPTPFPSVTVALFDESTGAEVDSAICGHPDDIVEMLKEWGCSPDGPCEVGTTFSNDFGKIAVLHPNLEKWVITSVFRQM